MRRFFLLCVLFAFLVACQLSEGTRQLPDEAYVSFLGDVSGYRFQLGESEMVRIPNEETRFRVDAGPHVIRVYDGTELVLEKKIYAAAGQVVEVPVR